MKKWLFIFIFAISYAMSSSQILPLGVDGDIHTVPNDIDFRIVNMRSITNGITYEDIAAIYVYYCDSNYLTSGWELYLKAEEPEFEAIWYNSIPTIPLSAIKITSRMENGRPVAINEPLDNIGILIGDGLNPSPDKCLTDIVFVSITCSSLLGYSFDKYVGRLKFELKVKN